METTKTTTSARLFALIGALAAWFAVVFQFYLIILNREESIAETIARFFGFYTILTNILVALTFTFLFLKSNFRLGMFFTKTKTLAATAVYIMVVGMVYNLILRFIWSPQGLQRVVDEMLHVVVPLLFVFYWLVFAPKKGLLWKNVFPWLIYPLVYLLCVLARGAVVTYYPYPFLEVHKLGYGQVLLNCLVLFGAFLGVIIGVCGNWETNE